VSRALELARALYVSLTEGLGRLVFGRSHAARTDGRVHLDELGLGARNRISYTPSGWLTLRRALPRRSVDGSDVFIDYGSGKGRVVMQAAARYPFKRVIGLEISSELNDFAQRNLDGARHGLACEEVELVTADVLEYQPPDDVTIAYMYNPFRGDILATAVRRLIASVDRNPRGLRLIYVNPIDHDLLMATGRFELKRKLRGLRPTKSWARSASTHVYEVVPRATAGSLPTS
jgi:hypothetical protein